MPSHPAGAALLALALCVLLEDGMGQPPLQSHLGTAAHLRTKRCSCNSWLDKECIYFCHLDIIWVNTPGHTAPYGLGSPPRRRKRSPGRCECSRSGDSTCASFCQEEPRDLAASRLQFSKQQHRAQQSAPPAVLPWKKSIWKKKR
ncbi:hypothetical protein CIB84_011677 [Bambusicola thoracicus]|uniref:Endothelin-like toxin domain-containing protein n=1 Tax=Bambusicola thoracicus TaxID=9083 RepID=A0A2P4SKE2_BAMTH|nr:hypothetical protein CIB84_011677 [Bambusicola thoracicus]